MIQRSLGRSATIDLVEIHRHMGGTEVWRWNAGRMHVLDHPTALQAVRAFRRALAAGTGSKRRAGRRAKR
jgi:hypothetical protein